MPKKKQHVEKCEGPEYPIGAKVSVARPHIWAGYFGRVVSVKDNRHRILVKSTQSESGEFHIEACGSDLRLEELE